MTEVARSQFTVYDLSAFIESRVNGYVMMEIIAQKGPINSPTLCANWPGYEGVHGTFLRAYDGPYQVKRSMSYGAAVYVNRIAHYTDPTNADTLTALKSSVEVFDRSVEPAAGVLTGDVSLEAGLTFNGTNKVLVIKVDGVAVTTTFDEAAHTESEILAHINAELGSLATATVNASHYLVITHALPGTHRTLEVDEDASTAETALGVGGLGEVAGVGVLAFVIWAYSEGEHGDQLRAEITEGTINPASEFNLIVSHATDPTQYRVFEDLSMDLTATNSYVDAINGVSKMIEVEDKRSGTAAPDNRPAIGEYSLSGGDDGLAGLNAADFIGDETAGTGFFAFDTIDDSITLCAPDATDVLDNPEVVHAAGLAYAQEHRGDVHFFCTTPQNLSPAEAVDFRLGQGDWSYDAPNTYFGCMVWGDLEVRDPFTGKRGKYINPLGDMMGLIARSDYNKAEWFSPAGTVTGKLIDVFSVRYDVGTSGRSAMATKLAANQVNMIMTVRGRGICLWDAQTLQRAATQLRQLPTARLMTVMKKATETYGRDALHQPIGPELWKSIGAVLKPWVRGLKARYAFTEAYVQCDDNAADITSGKLNTPEVIERGEVIARIYIRPTILSRLVGFQCVITNQSVKFQDYFNVTQL